MAKVSSTFLLYLLVVFSVLRDVSATKIKVYELKRGDMTVKLTNYGATVLSVILPDRDGKLADVVLGYQTVDEYKNDTTYFGGLIGRVANRIGGAEFTLNGVEYKLPANDHGNTLHGGFKGFNNRLWKATSYKKNSHVTFTYLSHDGEQGFPGALKVMVTYTFIQNDKLALKMEATPLNKPTPVNLASHTYWNLAGDNSGDIFNHTIQILASQITPVDAKLIPTGALENVQGTPYDFREPRLIGSEFNQLPDGYDMNYALYPSDGKHFRKAVVVYDSKSGRQMEIWTNQLGLQFYTSNMLTDTVGKGGFVYKKYAAMCLETQGFPDSVNHPNFPSQIVNPGEKYTHVMVYRFTTH